MKCEDAIVQEVQRIKEAHAARYNYDIRAMGRALSRAERRGRRRVVTRTTKRPLSA